MSSDEITRKPAKDEEPAKETQPTMTAVFRLIQDVEARLTARLAAVETRVTNDNAKLNDRITELDTRVTELNTRVTELNTRVTELNTRVTAGFKELIHKTTALNRRALQQEAGYEDLAERIEHLESKAS